jgi:L-ascorbate metabolism protein UlaG (beta-lactamase superfamily)
MLVVPVAWSQEKKDKDDPKDKDKQAKKQEERKPAYPGKLVVSWHGQSFFSVQTKAGTVFVFDPHDISQYGRPKDILPDLIFVSHNHNDHTQVNIFPNVAEKGEKAPKIVNGLKQGADGRETWNLVEDKFKDISYKLVGAYHDDVKGMKHGLTALFVVDVDGWKICHLGDLGERLSKQQLKAIGQVDVVMVPCGGIYGLNGSEAQDVISQLKPKEFIFPMHIGNSRYDELLPVDEFIDDNSNKCAIVRDGVLVYSPNARNNVGWLRENSRNSDNTLILERDANRKGPVIVNLHYWPQENKKKAADGDKKATK